MEITANTAQTVAVNQNVLFNEVAIPGSPSIIHRPGSGLICLRGLTVNQPRARFKINFNGNMAVVSGGSVASISLAIALEGESIGPTTMIVTPDAVEDYFNVSSSIFIDIPAGCCAHVSVKNISTQSISVQNANLLVERVA